MLKTVEDPSRFGVAVCDGEKIIKLVEKPKELISKLALVGLYYIANTNLLVESLSELLRRISKRGEYQLTDALQIMIEKGETITTFQVDGWARLRKTGNASFNKSIFTDKTWNESNGG